jgi:hypothetical protein
MAFKNRSDLQTNISSTVTTNDNGEITGANVRQILLDFSDSVPFSGEVLRFSTGTLNQSGIPYVSVNDTMKTSPSFLYMENEGLIIESGSVPISGAILSVRGRARIDSSYSLPIANDVGAATTPVNVNVAFSNYNTLTLNSSKTVSFINAMIGQRFILRVTQGSGFNITWSSVKWTDGLSPVLSPNPGQIDVFGFLCTAVNQFDGFIIGQAMA